MPIRADRSTVNRDGVVEQIPEVPDGALQRQAELLIEITVKEISLPIHADQLATHHSLKIVCIVGLFKQVLVRVQPPLVPE